MPDLLREIPDNPIPENAAADVMEAADGVRIRYARFPASAPNGTVIILPGRNEFIEKYFETIGDLRQRGFAAVALDWRGQGGSDRLLRDRMRGHIESFDSYVDDLDRFFFEVVLPDCRPPYTILGHSTGALIALLATPHLINRVRRIVLAAPLLELRTPLSPPWLKAFANLFCALGLGTRYIAGSGRRGRPTPFQSNKLTNDARRYARNQALVEAHPDLGVGGPTAAWLRAALLAAERVSAPQFMARMHLPILFLAAGSDTVVSTPAIESYAAALPSARALTVDGARHELFQEADIYREQALAAFAAFAGVPENERITA